MTHLLKTLAFSVNVITLLWFGFSLKIIFSKWKKNYQKIISKKKNDGVLILLTERWIWNNYLGHTMIYEKVVFSVMCLGKQLFSAFIISAGIFLFHKSVSHGRKLYLKLNISINPLLSAKTGNVHANYTFLEVCYFYLFPLFVFTFLCSFWPKW